MIQGRDREREAIDRLLARAREGHAARLLLEGEPGVGKTALLRYAIERADGVAVLRATGIESEAELEFSGLHELCRPVLDLVDALPRPQASALRGALGLETALPGDRFATGAAALGLLAEACEEQPLLVVVDDAQWLDRASADALCFAARRLDADSIAFLAAARVGEAPTFERAGFDRMTVGALGAADARALVGRPGSTVDDGVLQRLLAHTGGNALGLIEAGRALSGDQLAGLEPLPDLLPVGPRIEQAYAERLASLPRAARTALVVMAVAGEDRDALVRALAALGSPGVMLEEAEDAGLVAIQDNVPAFRHPLMRSAVAGASRPAERRAAHRLLADALAEAGSAERRAWHLAAASVGPDAAVADALALAAVTARERTGFGAASAAYERAALLTPDSAVRRQRLAHAAEAAFGQGASTRTVALANEALEGCDDLRLRAELLRLLGRVELQAGGQTRARELFVGAAESAADGGHLQLATMAMSYAVFSCHFGGRIMEAVSLSERCVELAPDDDTVATDHAAYVHGRSLLLAGQYEAGRRLLEPLVDTWLSNPEQGRVTLARAATSLAVLGRDEEAAAVVANVERIARDEGPMALVYALSLVAELAMRGGRLRQVARAWTEGYELAQQLGQANVAATLLAVGARLHAMRGDEPACRQAAETALAAVESSEMALTAAHIRSSLGLLALGLDRCEEAVAALEPLAAETGDMRLVDSDVCPAPDLVEALVRLGQLDVAARRRDEWHASARGSAPWLVARRARCDGLLADDDAFEGLFAVALEQETGSDPLAAARTRLCLGERLRRSGRRVDARRELRAALEVFERLELTPWAERTRRELRASGEKLGRRTAARGDDLTPQELQVALQVAEGKQNKEVAAALFLSPKTVEFHLGRVYRKLGVSTRAELARRFATEAAVVA